MENFPSQNKQAKTTGFTVTSFTSQDMHPGVEMNLWKTTKYRLEIDAHFPAGSHDFEILVDSISIPASLIQDRAGIPFDATERQRYRVKFAANHHFYRPGTSGAMTLPEESYAPSGVFLEHGTCWFTFLSSSNKVLRWDIGTPSTLPTIYAP